MNEGYIKFQAEWAKSDPLLVEQLSELQTTRQILYARGLIGAYPDGIGYGNISRRVAGSGQFIITGSATGKLPQLGPEHYSLVTKVDIANNQLHCCGPIIASSESMSHAAIYRTCPWVNGVIHIHSLELWERLLEQAPTTDPGATYGSPAMAHAIERLLQDHNLAEQRILVMAGHREGIFTFGKDLQEAQITLEKYLSWLP